MDTFASGFGKSIRLSIGRSSVTVIACLGLASVLLAQEPNEKEQSKEAALVVRRAELMREKIDGLKIESVESGFPTEFFEKPVFKYSDPSRGHVAGAIWKLAHEGRPKALIATELDVFSFGKPSISYELISLSSTPFSVFCDDFRWEPNKTLYEFKPLPNAPVPENTAQRRLSQMRELLKRFASREEVQGEQNELRALTQPIDRYTPTKTENSDGAIFLFAYGTNPEVVLILESDGQKWNFAAGRMTGAKEVVLTYEGVNVWQGGPLDDSRNSPFTGRNVPIEIPGFARDGSRLKD